MYFLHELSFQCIFHLNRQTSDTESSEIVKDETDNRVENDRKHTFSTNVGHRLYESRNFSAEENDDAENEGFDKSDLVNSKTINDILKYGAHQSVDSNPGETQSEWSDDDDKDEDEAKGKHQTKCAGISKEEY